MSLIHKRKVVCGSCHNEIILQSNIEKFKYCPFCANLFQESFFSEISSFSSSSFVEGHVPEESSIQFTIGPYQILKSIGKGGMGEVFLAYDTTCGRRIALKRIRSDLLAHKQLRHRFLKEARITSQLVHPSVIPIYSIQEEEDPPYYTMPFVEGRTLKEILRQAKRAEEKSKIHNQEGSIPSLIRIFINICQAVSFAHSKGVLHRDLKPENIIVGPFGEVLILDWGLAVLENQKKEEVIDLDKESSHRLTRLGKVVGTLSYMAPERAFGVPADQSTDIYALGVILYYILTLKIPFHRPSLKTFKKNAAFEVLKDPQEVAPYRDVPKILCIIVEKCLNKEVKERYQSVQALIHDLENYIEGRPEWFHITSLHPLQKQDWEFQENVFIAEHMAITRGSESSHWASLMVSKDSFSENIKIEASVKIGERGHGIGFLLSIPEAAERVHLNDGYCLWLGSDRNRTSKLLRSAIEVVHCPEIILERHEWYRVCIEKMDNNIHVYLNGSLQFSYISYQPLSGTHVGLISRDADYTLEELKIFTRGQNITVSCLAVPDAFLAHKNYTVALSEYRRIAQLFLGRFEGYLAQFRAGVTLLEEAKSLTDSKQAAHYLELAHQEFEKLNKTPGTPLEYLGKALIYQTLKEYEEEAKCFEIAWRKYPNHPLRSILEEQVVYRMHDSSRSNRKATYYFLFFVVRHLPHLLDVPHTARLVQSLEKHWEPLPFIFFEKEEKNFKATEITLGFWLNQKYMIKELVGSLLSYSNPSWDLIINALFSLIEIGDMDLVKEVLDTCEKTEIDTPLIALLKTYVFSKEVPENDPFFGLEVKQQERLWRMCFERAILRGDYLQILKAPFCVNSTEEGKELLDSYRVLAALFLKDWKCAGAFFHHYPLDVLSDEKSPLYFLYGCWLLATEGKEVAALHFSSLLEVPFPRTTSFLGYYLKGLMREDHFWFEKTFLFEKRAFYRQLSLYFHCASDEEKAIAYEQLYRDTYD